MTRMRDKGKKNARMYPPALGPARVTTVRPLALLLNGSPGNRTAGEMGRREDLNEAVVGWKVRGLWVERVRAREVGLEMRKSPAMVVFRWPRQTEIFILSTCLYII